ncbi:restriction endonuclease subunit S [Bifidobacterium adolescentis]|nr:restriction endonuclease subunit S [Bifidobacterium adolescentis]
MTDKPQFVGKKVKLGELCEICSGGTPKRSVAEYWKDGTIPWVKIGDMSEKYVSSTEERITDAGFNNSSVKMLEPGTLLYSIFASIGAVSILKIPATTNQAIAGLKIKDDSLDRDFLYHYLKSRESISKSSGRGAAQNNINLTILRNMQVTLPSIEIQRSIVRNLEMISNQVTIAESHLMDLDALVKSRFVEMFGTPDNNIHSLPIKTMGGISEQLIAGGDKPRKISKNKDLKHPYPVFANGTIADGLQGFSEEARVNKSAVTIAARGTIGFCLVREPGFTPIVRLISLVPKPSINVVYLKYFIDLLNLAGSGSSQAQLTLPAFREQQILVPELKEQLEFATFVAQVDKSRFVAQQQIEKLQMLYDSLAQEYFGD